MTPRATTRGRAERAAINGLWADTHARLPIDPQRSYAAGFSGGARLACTLGHILEGGLAGVIAVGGGFPLDRPPSKAMKFAVFGTVGTRDFNYYEMRQLDGSSLGSPCRIASRLGRRARLAAGRAGHAGSRVARPAGHEAWRARAGSGADRGLCQARWGSGPRPRGGGPKRRRVRHVVTARNGSRRTWRRGRGTCLSRAPAKARRGRAEAP